MEWTPHSGGFIASSGHFCLLLACTINRMNAFAYFETLNSLFVCVCLSADGLREHFELSSNKPTIFCLFRNYGKNFFFCEKCLKTYLPY